MSPEDHLTALGIDGPLHPISVAIEQAGAAADDQATYERAYRAVFAALDELNGALVDERFLAGAEPGPDDWRLFVVLIRFDAIYRTLYRLDRRRIDDYPQLSGWLRDLHSRLEQPYDLAEDQREAFTARTDLNPTGVVPLFRPDLWAPHDRDRFAPADLRARGTNDEGRGPAGQWVRGRSGFRDAIEAPDEGRYHLILADNCPWCHRVALTRSIKQLNEMISVDRVYFRRDPDRGWQYRPDIEGFDRDRLYGHQFVRQLYAREGSSERSVPILFDKKAERIVSNESADIIRMLDDAWPDHGPRLAPPHLRPAIDRYNVWIYRDINNGAYKAGFTRSQEAYEHAYHRFFAALDRLEDVFAAQKFLCGEEVTEADVRLFPTLFRLDAIYSTRFKLGKKLLRDYRHLPRWLDDMLAIDGVAEASSLENSKQGYFGRHGSNLVPPG